MLAVDRMTADGDPTRQAAVPGEPPHGGGQLLGVSRRHEQRADPVREEPRCLRASQNTGSAPKATAVAWATRRSEGSGHTHQSGAKAASRKSVWAPSREICSPRRSVIRNGSP